MDSLLNATSLPEDFSNMSMETDKMPVNSWPDEPPECRESDFSASLYRFPDWLLTRFYEHKYFEKIVITVLIPIVFVFGFVGNVAFLFVVARLKEMRTLTNFYLANLAIVDLLYVTLTAVRSCLQYALSNGLKGSEIFRTNTQCLIGYGSEYATFYASLSLVTLVTFERFLAICYPLKHRAVNTKKRTVTLVVISWVIAVGIAVPVAPAAGRISKICLLWPSTERWQKYPAMAYTCYYVTPGFINIRDLALFIPFVIVLVINTVLYSQIIARLSNRAVITNERSKEQSSANKVRNQVARMLIINGIIFFLCLVPYQVDKFHRIFSRYTGIYWYDKDTRAAINWVSKCLLILNSSINPYVYNFTNNKYRSAFVKALGLAKNDAKSSTKMSSAASTKTSSATHTTRANNI
ncbi:growth hormone secretagogue receptor type 1-like [Amphiura filiformis]|uniref:growth hormone secretagogue receptor type 1-like n=1 Tax=Amphiura filiformis TaxID=82378 RepID=UPI003B2108BF